jgi:hypothetical protein
LGKRQDFFFPPPLRPGLAVLAAGLIHRSGGPFFGFTLGNAPLLVRLLDVLVLPRTLAAFLDTTWAWVLACLRLVDHVIGWQDVRHQRWLDETSGLRSLALQHKTNWQLMELPRTAERVLGAVL